jgi:FkbM family methyltransferase
VFSELKLKKYISRRLSGTRAFFSLREIYQKVFNRSWAERSAARRNFYRQFIKREALVFDVGANVGEYSHTFLQLGARVVALEPNPECYGQLRAQGNQHRLTVCCEAIGEREGGASLFIGDHSGHSTVSEEWMGKAATNDPGCQWSNVIKTHMSTLDRVREKHGTPEFIKIDVEGHEASVLRGMSFKPSALSFEFHAYSSELTKECLLLPIFDSKCQFNIVLDDTWRFVWSEWRDKQAVFAYTSNLTGKVFGDIYVRFD